MKSAALILASIFCSMPALSDDFEGGVCYHTHGGYGVRPTSDTVCYKPLFEDPTTKDDFNNLLPGDSLTFSATILPGGSISIESISTISLYRLFGGWKDTKNRYYNFANYTDLVIYDPASPEPVKTESFKYELYPNSYQRWGIALTSSKHNNVGLLRQFVNKSGDFHFEICLYQDNLPARKRVCSTLTRLPN